MGDPKIVYLSDDKPEKDEFTDGSGRNRAKLTYRESLSKSESIFEYRIDARATAQYFVDAGTSGSGTSEILLLNHGFKQRFKYVSEDQDKIRISILIEPVWHASADSESDWEIFGGYYGGWRNQFKTQVQLIEHSSSGSRVINSDLDWSITNFSTGDIGDDYESEEIVVGREYTLKIEVTASAKARVKRSSDETGSADVDTFGKTSYRVHFPVSVFESSLS